MDIEDKSRASKGAKGGILQLLCENIVVDNAATREREDQEGYLMKMPRGRGSKPMRNDILLFLTPSRNPTDQPLKEKSVSSI